MHLSYLLTNFLFCTSFSTPCTYVFVLQLLHVDVEDLHPGAASLVPSMDYPYMGVAFSTLHCGAYHGKSNGEIMVTYLNTQYMRCWRHYVHCNTLFFTLLLQIADQNIIIPLKGNVVNTFQLYNHSIVERLWPACDLWSGLYKIRLKRNLSHFVLVMLSTRYPLTA